MIRKILFVAAVTGSMLLSVCRLSAAVPQSDRPSPLTFNLSPGAVLPIDASSDLYKLGLVFGLSGEYRSPGKPLFFLSGNIGKE